MPSTQPTAQVGTASSGLGILLTGGPSAPHTWSRAPEHFAKLEANACSAIWIADHLFWGEPMPECLVMAAVAAASTRSCTIGTGVLQAPLRHASSIAKAAATLQEVSGGRFVLGLGTGEHEEEYRRAGSDFDTRGRQLDETIETIRSLWTASDDWYAQRPVPTPIPVWLGGRSRRALRRTAAVADGWMPIFISPEGFTTAMAELVSLQDHRAPAAVTKAPVVIVAVTDRQWSRADALGWMANLWRTDPSRLGRYLVSGPPDACAEELARFHHAGADHVVALVAQPEPIAAFATLNHAYRERIEP